MVRPALFLALSALGLAGQFAPARAPGAKERSKKDDPAASLKVGDLAPPLKASKWLQGKEVRKFEPGKVYVVEFWAPWCPACVRHTPHLARLQARYKEQGVTIVGFTSRDIRGVPGNTAEKLAAFIKRRGDALSYTFAYGDDGTTTDAWLKAAGQQGFCTFVVDRAGRIAFIGWPMYLDLVLPKVLAGQSAKAVGEEMAKVDADYRAVAAIGRDRDPEAYLRALKQFEARYPPLADFLPAANIKLDLLLRQGKADEGKQYAGALVAKAIKQHDGVVLDFAYSQLRDQKSKELVGLAVRAAEALVRFNGGKEPHSLLRLADAHFVSGDRARAKEYARRAVEAVAGESATFRQDIEKEARRLGAEK
jgi:thiol-disulfide isomerase/thioredoxin